jgi:hypothetical protein
LLLDPLAASFEAGLVVDLSPSALPEVALPDFNGKADSREIGRQSEESIADLAAATLRPGSTPNWLGRSRAAGAIASVAAGRVT